MTTCDRAEGVPDSVTWSLNSDIVGVRSARQHTPVRYVSMTVHRLAEQIEPESNKIPLPKTEKLFEPISHLGVVPVNVLVFRYATD